MMKKRMVRYLCQTRLNKLFAGVLILVGAISSMVIEDATLLMFMLCIAIPLMVSKENWIEI